MLTSQFDEVRILPIRFQFLKKQHQEVTMELFFLIIIRQIPLEVLSIPLYALESWYFSTSLDRLLLNEKFEESIYLHETLVDLDELVLERAS
jgi:hypothetical protein